MGKIRVAKLGDEEQEAELKRRAEARRQTKQSKKAKVEHVGLKGGERVAVVEGTDIKPEFRKLVEEVEQRETPDAGGASDKKKKSKTAAKARSKKYKEMLGLVDKSKLYAAKDAIQLVKQTSMTKFDGTVELHLNLNTQALGDKKDMRGEVSLPHGSGKQVRVMIADDALLSKIESGKLDFDILVAPPSMMPKLARFARVPGPKGLMPNPKNGTVSETPEKRAKELSQGKIQYKTEPENPILHLSIGKVSFGAKELAENLETVLTSVGKNKISRATLTATMGPGVKLKLV